MSLADAVNPTPEHMTVVNLASGDELEAQFNPAELQETVGAEYASQTVLGLSHRILQFIASNNDAFEFTMFFSSANGGPIGQRGIERARRFLRSLVKPRSTAGTIKTAGAPRALFVWPGLLSVTCVLKVAVFNHQRFNLNGASVFYSAKCTLEEIRDTLITSEDVFAGKG